jgi:hypothetical protein
MRPFRNPEEVAAEEARAKIPGHYSYSWYLRHEIHKIHGGTTPFPFWIKNIRKGLDFKNEKDFDNLLIQI